MKQGYYSLVQYCPNWARLEVCNIGVVLFCPELHYLDVRMTQKPSRIRSFFGNDPSVDSVQNFANMFANRIRYEKDNIRNLESFEQFISSRANHFLITKPCSMAVCEEPDQELENLYGEIFGTRLMA